MNIGFLVCSALSLINGEENIIKKMNNFVDMCFESDIIEGKKD